MLFCWLTTWFWWLGKFNQSEVLGGFTNVNVESSHLQKNAHQRFVLSHNSIKKNQSSNEFLFRIALANKTQNYYYYFYQFSNFKSHLRVNDNSDWLEILRVPPGHQNLLSKIRFFDNYVLTKSYGSKPLKITVFVVFQILVCKIHLKLNDVIKPF